MSIQVVNGPEFARNLQRRLQAIDRGMDTATNKTATMMYAELLLTTPVGKYPKGSGRKGGTLRKGWQKKKEGKWHYIIKNEVKYAPYVEFGTSRMAGRFMMTNAIHKFRPIHVRQCAAAIKKAVS